MEERRVYNFLDYRYIPFSVWWKAVTLLEAAGLQDVFRGGEVRDEEE